MITSRLAIVAALETLVNTALRYDPLTQQQLAHIDDQVIRICCTQPSQVLWVHISDGVVRILSQWDDPVDASISGKLTDFIALAREQDKNQVLMSTRMEISGNTQLLTRLQTIAGNLNLDWEAGIADLIGDLPGHWLATAMKFGAVFAQDVHRSLSSSWHNYWQYETDTLVTTDSYQNTATAISAMRFDTDRLEARIVRLQKKRTQTS